MKDIENFFFFQINQENGYFVRFWEVSHDKNFSASPWIQVDEQMKLFILILFLKLKLSLKYDVNVCVR